MTDEIKKLREEIAELLCELDYKEHMAVFPDDKDYPTWSGSGVIFRRAYYNRADAILHVFTEHGGCLLAEDQNRPLATWREITLGAEWANKDAKLIHTFYRESGFRRVILPEEKRDNHED